METLRILTIDESSVMRKVVDRATLDGVSTPPAVLKDLPYQCSDPSLMFPAKY
jgi:hypothetical protein